MSLHLPSPHFPGGGPVPEFGVNGVGTPHKHLISSAKPVSGQPFPAKFLPEAN